jgi:pyridoxal phosphate enzyme (YggS family)
VPNPDHPFYRLTETCRQYGATLVAVSKTRTIAETDVLYQMGQRIFAENRAQELQAKASVMPSDIEWHLIGHLQTNKVRSVLPYVSCIQSLDRISLWEKIQEEAERIDKRVTCLLQIKVAMEETKYGWEPEELYQFLASGKHKLYPNVILGGVMGMASFTDDTDQVRKEMKQIRSAFDLIRQKYFQESLSFRTISMGMSGDYLIALEEGSTMIRVGSLLFPPADHK